MRLFIGFVTISIYMFTFSSMAAIPLDENSRPINQESIKIANDGFAMRNLRKVGFGVGSAGSLGLLGAMIELNFTSDMSLMTSFGLASNYQTFGLQVKKILGGKAFMPYFSAGYTRWYTTGDKGAIHKTTPKFFGDKFLNSEERSSGKIAENILYPGFGFQYMQLNGDWAGTSLYAEILLLIDVDDLQSEGTGGLGLIYYF